jgi:hypothetical protein
MSDAGSNVEISGDPISEEIGSGEVESDVIEDSGLAQEIDGDAVDDLQEEVADAIADGASEAEIQELVETFRIKVNGQERDVTLDWNNKEDIVRRLQMAEAGQGAMQRSASMEKEFNQILLDAQDDPYGMLQQLGYNPVEFAEQIIQNQIQELQKSPEQIAQEERDDELEELRERLRGEEQQREDYQFNQLKQEAMVDLDNEITSALSATTDLPKSPYVIKRISEIMMSAIRGGNADITADDVIPWVEKEINDEMQELFASMPEKAMANYIGTKNLDRLRKTRLKKMPKSLNKGRETGKGIPLPERKKGIKLNDWLRQGSSLKDFDD